jgi:hypothetical protein
MPRTTTTRAIGYAAPIAAVSGTLLAPIHALSRYATADGAADLDSAAVRAWAVPAARRLHVLLDWSNPQTVYTTYGRLWLPIFATAVACAFAIGARRHPTGFERWGWRITLVGYVIAAASLVGDYWTPWMDASFAMLGIPGMLVSVTGSTLLGIALLRRRFRPRVTGWLLATWFPALVVLSSVIALGAGLLPMLWAWAVAGHLLRVDLQTGDDLPRYRTEPRRPVRSRPQPPAPTIDRP